jgi:hypothetical protein
MASIEIMPSKIPHQSLMIAVKYIPNAKPNVTAMVNDASDSLIYSFDQTRFLLNEK